MKKYRITLNEQQMIAIKNICELRFRIDLLQEYDLAELLSTMDCLDLSPSNPKHKEIFDSYLDRREHISVILKALFEIACPFSKRISYGRKRDPEALIAEDIWQTIRYKLWQDNPNKGDSYTVDSRPPFQVSEQELPTIETLEE